MNRNLIYALQQTAVVAILVASACIVAFGKNDGKKDDDVKLYFADTGVITILTDDPGDIKYPVYYGDSFFRSKSTEENIRMANFALGLELSCSRYSVSEGGMPQKVSQDNLKAFYADIGFTNVEINKDFESEPEIDSIGVGIGSKEIDGSTVLAVAINGVNYSAQFGGNFKVGQTGTHEGFQIAANKVVQFIKEYIAGKQITGDIKILTTGYSRGAAISNVTQAMIDDAIAEGKVGDLLGNVNITRDDMYGFGFMTPMTAPTDGEISPTDPRYDNIFSYIDPNDLVPMVPPTLFKFTHYGHVIKVPSNDKNLVQTWQKYVVSYFGEEVQQTYDRSTYKPAQALVGMTEGEVMQEFINRFAVAVCDGDRQTYYDEVQDSFSWATFILFSNTQMLSDIYGQIVDDILMLVWEAIRGKEFLIEELYSCLDDVFDKYGLEEKDADAVVEGMAILTFGILGAQGGVLDILSDPYFKTLFDNGTYMLMPHMPSSMCGWMFYLDPDYPEGGIGQRYDGGRTDASGNDAFSPS